MIFNAREKNQDLSVMSRKHSDYQGRNESGSESRTMLSHLGLFRLKVQNGREHRDDKDCGDAPDYSVKSQSIELHGLPPVWRRGYASAPEVVDSSGMQRKYVVYLRRYTS